MKFTPKIKKFQAGGQMPAETEAPVEQEVPVEEAPVEEAPQQQHPLIMLAEGAIQALQNQDCNVAMQVCQGLIQLVQQAAGPAPEAAQGEPVFRKGGVLVRRIKK